MFSSGATHYPGPVAQAKWEIIKQLISGGNIKGHTEHIRDPNFTTKLMRVSW